MRRLPSMIVLGLCTCMLAACERAETPTLDAPPGDPAPTTDPAHEATTATLHALTVGDRACYVSLLDAHGAQREEMAVFEVCEREELVGRRVQASMGSGEIIAEACEGDPECDHSETVTLVVDLRAAD